MPGGMPLPPSLRAAPPGGGPVSMPQGNPGTSLKALANVQTALMLLQEALPSLPLGSAVHTSVLKSVGDIAKNLPQQGAGDQQQMSALQQLQAKLAQQQPNNALQAMAKPPGAGAPPVLPPPGAGGAPDGAPPMAMAA